ncbi:diguanylate cyclase domain-containing protein [Rhizobium sp. TRM95796]|uniref:diguanylate cyclase domain-containing protein n=1 Tax=Rhizobium sp. TRM95796 TaxID=2979862 RepID=UPI0021E842B4|nr:diguanylate cyclase [Rhizobium sp. TRM95796]MCV3764338.1 diguanylate cyclase [Rhizobium sp. TRM95796]
MMDLAADAGSQFIRRLILPLCALIAGLIVLAFAGLLWIADYQTQVAVRHQSRLARHALQVQAERLGPSASDYGYWDDAVANIVDKPDLAWMRAQIGAGPEQTLGLDFSFVIGPDGETIYSYVKGSRQNGERVIDLPHAFRFAYRAWLKNPTKTFAAVIPYQSQAVTIAVAPVASVTDVRRPATGYSIVFVDRFDDAALDRLEQNFDLDDLRLSNIAEEAPHPDSAVEIRGNSGDAQKTFLIWNPSRPGDQMLRIVMPFFAVLVLALAALGLLLARFISNSSRLISDREQRAGSDSLTGLANRARLNTELEDAVRRVSRGFSGITVMYIDLDGFKQVNDRFGHACGDELLQEVARRLKDCLRTNDLVARLGGDEFVVLMTGWIERSYIQAIAARILLSIGNPIALSTGQDAHIGCSIGIADSWEPDVTAQGLLKAADAALYEAKAAGKNTLRFHHGFAASPDQHVDIRYAAV